MIAAVTRWRAARLLGAALVASAALAVPASAQAGAQARAGARYALTVDFRGAATYQNFDSQGGLTGEGRFVSTYHATSVRPFSIRRSGSRSKPRFSFATQLAGEFTHQGGGYGGVGGAGCVYKWTEEVWPDKTAVDGFATMDRTSAGRIGILVTPVASGRIGTVKWRPDANCAQSDDVFNSASLELLNIPMQYTDAVDLRHKLGRAFTIRYAPGAIPDRPNIVRGTTTATFDFSWTLRFKPARR